MTPEKRPAARSQSKATSGTKAAAKRKAVAKRAAPKAEARRRSGGASEQVPAYDASAVGRLVPRIEIDNVELVYAHFDRSDDGPLPTAPTAEFVPEVGIDYAWELDERTGQLGSLIRFGAMPSDGEDPPYQLFAFFRLTYSVEDARSIADADIEQFVAWNAVFNAWPYFREYLSSTLNRAGFPRVTLPVMRVPRAGDGAPSED